MMKGKLSRKMFFSLIAALFIVIFTITLLTACNDNEKPSGDNEITVTISQTLNGTVTADKEKYLSGDTVTLTFAPDDGYELNAVSVNEINRTSAVRNGELVMENVTENLTVTTTFLARATGSISYSIKNNIGGMAQLSKTSGYIGESVTLTLTPERGYDVMSIVVNGGVNIANAIKNNSIEIELIQSVNTVEVEFYAFPIKVFATANDYGTVSIDNEKEIYALDDTVEIVLTPNAGCILDSLLVNGEEKIDEVSGNKLTFTISEIGNINVTAVFTLQPVHIDFAVSATRFGDNYDIKGASVEFKHENGKKYHDITINDESKIAADVVPGKYTVTIDGFAPVQLTVGTDGYTTQTTFVYNPFRESVAWNTSGYADGKINNSAYGHLLAKDDFDNFVLTVTLKNTSVRTSINFKYGSKMIGFSNDGSSAGLWLPGTSWGNIPWSDTAYETPSPDWYANDFANTAYSGDGAEFKFVRQGTKLYLFVEDTYVTSWEIFTADQKISFALTGWGSGEIPVNISTDMDTVNGLVESNVTSGTVTNGTVAFDKTDGKYTLGDTVTVTLTPKAEEANAKYVLESLILDGETVSLDRVNNGVFTFKISKNAHTVSATFKSVAIANIDVAVTATKFGEIQSLSEVVLSNANYNSVHQLNGGKLQVSGLAEGTYTVSADGYIPATIEVKVEGSSTVAQLVYNHFATSGDWTVTADSENNISISSGSEFSHLFFKEAQGDFALTYNIKKIATQGERRLAFTVKYGDNKMLAFTNVWNNDYGMSIPTGDWNIVWDGASHTYTGDWRTLEFTETEKAAYNSDSGINVSIVRQGTTLYVFFGERFVSRYELFNATEKVECAFTGWSLFNDSNEKFIIPVELEVKDTVISALVESNVAVDAVTHGTVTLDKTDGKYKIGDTVELTLAADTHTDENKQYVLKTLTVDGQPVDLSEINSGVYTFKAAKSSYTVAATFEEVNIVNLNIQITATKFGVEQTLNKVTLSGVNYSAQEFDLTNGQLVVSGLADDTYKISVEGYLPVTVSSSTESATLIYLPFADAEGWNTSNYADGKISNSAYGHLLSKDEFDNFVLTVTLKKIANVRTSINFKYGENVIGFSTDGNSAGLWLPGNNDVIQPSWSGLTYHSISPDWYGNEFANTAYSGDGAEYKFVRQGTKLYLFVENTYVASWEIFEETQKVEFALTGWGIGEISLAISIDTDTVNGLVESNVTAGTVTNGTVAFDNTDGKYTLGDEVTVTLTPNADEANKKYVLESVKLNDEDIDLSQIENGVYKFTVEKSAYTIAVVYKAVLVANIDVTITATKFGETQSLSEVVLSNANYNSVHQLNGGKLQVSGLAEGTYTVSADGYIPVNITVSVNGSSTTANLVYNPFATSNDWTVTADSENNISISSGSGYSHLFFRESQDNFVLTYNVKNITTDGERRIAFAVKYGDNKMLAITNVWNNDYGMSIPSGDWNIVWGGASHTFNDWITLDFNSEEKVAYNSAAGINVSIVRQGTTLYVFFGERFVSRYELFNAAEKVECAFTGWSLFNDNNEPFIIPVTVKTDDVTISKFTESTVSVQTATNGTLTLDKTNGKYFKGDNVTLTITPATHSDPNKKYVLSSLMIDEQSINVESISDGNYSFTATKANHTVAAEFTEVNLAMTLDITVTAEKYGETQTLTAVTLKGEGYEQSHALTEGKLIVTDLPYGIYTVAADGYIPVSVTNSTTAVTLMYQPFGESEAWNTASYADGKISHSTYGHLLAKDDFDNFVLTVTLKNTSVRTSINFKYGSKMIGFSNDGSSAGLWLPGTSWGNIPWSDTAYETPSPDWYANDFANTAYSGDGAEFKFVRQGTKLYLFVEDTYVTSWEIFTADQKVSFALTGWDSGEISVNVSTKESDVTEWVNKAS